MLEWFKEHPVETAIGVIALGLLLFGGRGGSSVAPVGPSENVQIAALTTGYQLQSDNLKAAVALRQIDATRDATLATLTAQLKATQINRSADVASNTIQAGVQQYGIAAAERMNSVNVDGSIRANADALRAQIQQTDSNNKTAVTLADMKYSTDRYGLSLNHDAVIAGYQSTQELAKTAAWAQVSMNQSNNGVTKHIADAQVTALGIVVPAKTSVDLAYQNNVNTAILTQAGYLQNLVNLKGYGKDISGLPGTGTTEGMISAGQPGNTTSAVISSIFGGIGKIVGAAAGFAG